jgi:hypothetical protein
MMKLERDIEEQNEIEDFKNLRSIGASEACWRIFSFATNEVHPSVQALVIHLESEQKIVFQEGKEALAVRGGPPETQLIMWFQYNRIQKDPSEQSEKYPNFPHHHVWNRQSKLWTKRKKIEPFPTIGRVHYVHPATGELYYLRLLLHNDYSLGACKFSDLRKLLDGRIATTYREVCLELGLLQDDAEWHRAIEEATFTQMPQSIRELFCIILEWCNPSDPTKLFHSFKDAMSEDYKQKYEDEALYCDEIKYAMLTLDIERRLNDNKKSLQDYNLPNVSKDLRDISASLDEQLRIAQLPSLLREEISYNRDEELHAFEADYKKLQDDQKKFINRVKFCIDNETPQVFFLDAIAGAGKTFCENVLLSYCRANGKIALSAATSGIASTLLKNGQTAQGRFHLPILTTENCTWNVSAQSLDANLFRETQLIVWDEISMAHRHLIEALDTGLRDITKNDHPFGGKVIVLAGDFRQILPIVKHGSRAQIVNACLKRSRIWYHNNIEIHELLTNMRLRLTGIDKDAEDYAKWLLSIGNGTAPTTSNEVYDDLVEIPENICMDANINELIDWVFPDIAIHHDDPNWICERAILTPKNKNVNEINETIAKRFPGNEILIQSADDLVKEYEGVGIPNEYLNTLNPPGLPPHHLVLKIGMPLILLRNLNPSQGLCNGTKLCLKAIHNKRLIEVEIIGGQHHGKIVCIPRIILQPKEGEFPFQWTRCQFPISVAFAITINKSQGQTLKKVGVYLPEPVFTHGQLYVAASRVNHPQNIRFAITPLKTPSSDQILTNKTRNIVYTEVLQNT